MCRLSDETLTVNSMQKEERNMIIIINVYAHNVDHFKEHVSVEQSKGSEGQKTYGVVTSERSEPKFLLSIIYVSPRRHSNSSKTFKKVGKN